MVQLEEPDQTSIGLGDENDEVVGLVLKIGPGLLGRDPTANRATALRASAANQRGRSCGCASLSPLPSRIEAANAPALEGFSGVSEPLAEST